MHFSHLQSSITHSFTSAFLVFVLLLASFLTLEPTVSRAIVDTHKVTQSVTAEISFLAVPSDVVMSPNLAGITGGTSSGSTTIRVMSNNDTGYNMTIVFSTTTAMTRNGGGGNIRNYNPASINVPDFTFSNEAFAQFAYSISASTTGDMTTVFKDGGASCNTSTGDVINRCWLNPSTTALTVINRTSYTQSSGATTSILFRVNIPNNPVPSVQEGTYVATATLTALVN